MKSSVKPDPRDSWTAITAATPRDGLLKAFCDILAEAFVTRLERDGWLRHEAQPRLMNQREAADYLGRSVRWLREETGAGRIECVREGKSRPRYDRESLDRYVEQRNGRD